MTRRQEAAEALERMRADEVSAHLERDRAATEEWARIARMLLDEIARVRRERDEAVAALRQIAEWCDHGEEDNDCPSGTARAALKRGSHYRV